MKDFALIILFFCLFWNSCEKEGSSIVEKYADGTTKLVMFIIDEKEGHFCYEGYFQNGNIKEQFCLKKGKLEGEKIEYYSSGSIKSKFQFKDGMREGACYEYNEEGEISLLNFCVKDKTIYGEFYRYDSSGVEMTKLFDPIVKLLDDSSNLDRNKVAFSVSLPIPERILDVDSFTFKYGLKPLSLKDSIVLSPRYEAIIYPDRPYMEELDLEGFEKQILYGYIYEEETKNVYNPVEFIVPPPSVHSVN